MLIDPSQAERHPRRRRALRGRAAFRAIALAALALWLDGCGARARPRPRAGLPAALAPDDPAVEIEGLRNIQRSMRLLASGEQRVRVLFYGQSITESAWSRKVEAALRRRFPRAQLEAQNRALGGFAAQFLVHSAESDLYPYYPDLVIFHVYGAHTSYEDIIRRIRERTTAEILTQSDHLTRAEELREQTDPQKLAPAPATWAGFMNYVFLPGLVANYQTALCDVRAAWKRRLRQRELDPSALLRDGAHPNAAGDALFAACLERCLRRAPELGRSPAEDWVETRAVGRELSWREGTLRVTFQGNRVDAVTDSQGDGTVRVRIDGKPPSALRELYTFSRARAREAGKWPPLYDLSSEAPLLLEDWELQVTRASAAPRLYQFELKGSKTGPDGSGRSDRRFVSRSGRVVIDPEDWNVEYAFELAEVAPVPEHFTVAFRVEPQFADGFGPGAGPSGERVVTLAQGLANGSHTLELHATGAAPLRALRFYRPPRARAP